MSLVDQLKQLATPQAQEAGGISKEDRRQLEDLEEAEATLKSIGVSLEPKFDISLAARIGATSTKR